MVDFGTDVAMINAYRWVGPGGSTSSLQRLAADPGNLLFPYHEFFLGGVSVAVGDVTGDGIPVLVTGAAPGGSLLRSFTAFGAGMAGGVTVGAARVDGDGLADLRIVSGVMLGELESFFAFDPRLGGGAAVA